jgi:hypothetical protein
MRNRPHKVGFLYWPGSIKDFIGDSTVLAHLWRLLAVINLVLAVKM